MEEIQMEIKRIVISDGNEQQVIMLKEKFGDRTFSIHIGTVEAVAIDRRFRGIHTQRPLTYDLMSSIISQLNGVLEKVVITDLQDQTFHARIYIRHNGRVVDIDSRPSDAIALGASNGTPIYVAEHVLNEVA